MSIRSCVCFLASCLLVLLILSGCGVEPGKLDSSENEGMAVESGCALNTPIDFGAEDIHRVAGFTMTALQLDKEVKEDGGTVDVTRVASTLRLFPITTLGGATGYVGMSIAMAGHDTIGFPTSYVGSHNLSGGESNDNGKRVFKTISKEEKVGDVVATNAMVAVFDGTKLTGLQLTRPIYKLHASGIKNFSGENQTLCVRSATLRP